MIPDVCVDIGNTRLKWLLKSGQFFATTRHDEHGWREVLASVATVRHPRIALTGVHPERLQAFADWITRQGCELYWVQSYRQIPLVVELPRPDLVGLDRLLGALAASRRKPADHAAIIADAGTAVTVNAVSPQGAFLGGAIAPGWRTLRLALHQQTAKLPFVDQAPEPLGTLPGSSTQQAIYLGTRELFLGGVERLIQLTMNELATPCRVYFTGGDGELLAGNLVAFHGEYVPTMTLEGLRLACESAS